MNQFILPNLSQIINSYLKNDRSKDVFKKILITTLLKRWIHFRYQSNLFKTSGTFPASPGSFLKKKFYINMTINIIHVLSNVVKISSNIKR